MTNKTKDDTGYSWQNYDNEGNKIQENSKTYEGEHSWYNVQTRTVGWHGANVTAEEKKMLAIILEKTDNYKLIFKKQEI